MLRSKSIVLILFWNFLVLTVFHYIVVFHTNNEIHVLNNVKFIYSGWCFAPVILLYPLMGWLADTRYGRYNTIKCGLWVMWVASYLLSLVSIVKYVTHSSESRYWSGVDLLFFTILSLGLSLFQANIIQFGIDQLIDASSADITSFINWYVWTLCGSEIVVVVTQKCSNNSSSYLGLLSTLLLPTFLSLSLLSDLLFSKYLIKEPVTYNPLRLLRNVLHYALKTKYPRQRSAFTYWNDKPYSRLDLAKSDYGGPFSTEEVENVKTFFRLLAVVCIMSPLIGVGYMYIDLTGRTVNFHDREDYSFGTKTCLKHWSIVKLGSGLVVLLIPFYELVLYPLCSKWLLKLARLLNMTSRNKFKAGIACLLLNYVIYLILYRFGTEHFQKYQDHCILYLNSKHKSYNLISYYWVPIPKLFECFAKIWLFGSALEFICAQCPYSMKGLLFGMAYTVCAVFVLIAYMVFLPFHYDIRNTIPWKKVPMGCEFWFLASCLTLTLVLAVVFMVTSCCYKKRQRSENPPNEHCFAEDYYDRSEPDLPFISDPGS